MASLTETPRVPAALITGDWQVTDVGSDVSFATRILFGLIPVSGRFTALSGELHIDADGRARGELRLDAEKISTGIKKRDRHLRSSDFFAVDEHRHLKFELSSLDISAEGALRVTGSLCVRDQAIAIDTPVRVEQMGTTGLRLSAEFPVDHRASGLSSIGPGWRKVPRALNAHVALALIRTD
jgi:polyisoprenoid-binding protein YceI